MAFAMGKPARLLPVPTVLLKTAGRLAGRGMEVERLCGSLQVDISKTQEALGWHPQISIDSALKDTVRHFLIKAMD
jgi:nucleoside-diphosphate-sugar epimerase